MLYEVITSYSPKAVRSGGAVNVKVNREGAVSLVSVVPARTTQLGWKEPTWAEAQEWKKAYRKLA